jgi:hypothetical protein
MNLESLSALAGQSVSMHEIQELNKALQSSGSNMAKASAGYPTQGVASTGSFAPLVPQSIQMTLDSATYTEQAVKFWKKLSKVNVTSPLHESTVVEAYGNMDLDPFIAEGGTGTNSDGTYARKIVKVKYLAEQREITDVATMAGIIGYTGGVSRQGLAQQTIDGTKAMMGKLERALFLSSATLGAEGAGDGLGFDGLYQQISGATYDGATGAHAIPANSSNYRNLDGAEMSPQDLVNQLYDVAASPNYGYVNSILLDPRVYARLVNIATSFGRFQMSPSNATQLVFGSEGLHIAGPSGMVPIEQAPLAAPRQDQNGELFGVPGTFSITAANSVVTASTTSKFAAADAGSYIYRFVGVGDKGITAPVKVQGNDTAVVMGAGQKVTFTMTDGGQPISGSGGIRYYRVYRTAVGGAVGDDATYMWAFPRNPIAAANTVIVDENLHRPSTGQCYLLQLTPDVMYWCQLLDFLRRPLAQTTTAIPFLLMLFGSLHVKVPTKCAIIDNVAF